jgi:hypothetical protein
MPTLADSIVSSSSRKLSIRARPDLKARKQRYQGRTYWVVKDPVALQYFRFEEEEFAILQMLDGESSLDEIAERFEAEFPPQTIRVEELQNFIGMLHRSGLVLSDAPGQGWQLKERRDEKKRQELLGAVSNLLAFRFRGFDPERFLNWLYPYVRWFFTPAATTAALMLAAAALTLVIVQFDVFQSRLPSFNAFFSAQNWAALAATLTATKILHEFGHGMSCKHFGGECHEMGVMFLVLTPCRDRRRWHVCRGGAGLDLHVHLVVQRAGAAELFLPERDVRQLGEHDSIQREPAAAVRRLLYPERHPRDSQPAAKVQQHSPSQAGQVVPRAGRAGGSVPAKAAPDAVCAVHGRRVSLSLGGAVFDSVFLEQGV